MTYIHYNGVMHKTDLKNLNLASIEQSLNLPKFRAKQVFHWIHNKRVTSFSDMKNLPKELRDELDKEFYVFAPKIIKTSKSKDGTIKYLLELEDGSQIECVYLKDPYGRVTVCVSSQVGCAMNCGFCATASLGFKRDLTVSEILSQVYLMENVSNVVFMGMGEPLLNYDNVLKAVHILNSKDGLEIGARKMTISTCGIVEGILKLAVEDIQVRLAVSLNSAIDDVRAGLMPIAKKYSVKDLKDSLFFYQRKAGRRATLEYVLLDGVNDSDDDLTALIEFCKGLKVNVNLIPYNEYGGKYKKSKRLKDFLSGLESAGIEAVMRISRGADIEAACGQLAKRA